MSRKGRVILLVICLIVYLSLCLLLVGHKLKRLDRQVTVATQQVASKTLDYIFSFFTLFGSIEVTTLAVLSLCGWLWKQGQGRAAFALFSLFVLGNAVELAFKQRLEASPPEILFHRSVFGLTLVSVKTRYGFPSGHVWRTAFLALTLGAFLRLRLSRNSWRIPLALILYVLVMAASRIYLGDHWASDTVGGIALAGIVFVFIPHSAFQNPKIKQGGV